MTRVRISDLPPDLRRQVEQQIGKRRTPMSNAERAKQQYRPRQAEESAAAALAEWRSLPPAEQRRRGQLRALRTVVLMIPRDTGLSEVDEARRLLKRAIEILERNDG